MSATIGPNDVGGTESDPYSMFATNSDVESWGRVHKDISDELRKTIATPEGSQAPALPLAQEWLEQALRFDSLANLDVWDVLEFGPSLTGNDAVNQTVYSAKEGKRLLELVRDQADMPDADDVGGSGEDETSGLGKDVQLFVTGGVLTLLGIAAYKFWPRE